MLVTYQPLELQRVIYFNSALAKMSSVNGDNTAEQYKYQNHYGIHFEIQFSIKAPNRESVSIKNSIKEYYSQILT